MPTTNCDVEWPAEDDVWDECTAAEAGLVDDPLHKDEADIVDLDMLPEDMPAFDIRSGDPLFIGDTHLGAWHTGWGSGVLLYAVTNSARLVTTFV